MKTIKITREGEKVLAILLVTDWFNRELIKFPIVRTDYVVVKWIDWNDGKDDDKIEAKMTIAICRELEDAQALYLHIHKQWARKKKPIMEQNY